MIPYQCSGCQEITLFRKDVDDMVATCPHCLIANVRFINALRAAAHDSYWQGFRAGIREYAWWKEGVQYVGSCGTTLEEALKRCGN